MDAVSHFDLIYGFRGEQVFGQYVGGAVLLSPYRTFPQRAESDSVLRHEPFIQERSARTSQLPTTRADNNNRINKGEILNSIKELDI